MSIAVINTSSSITDANGQLMVNALNTILPQFCSDWSLPDYKAIFFGRGTTSSIAMKIFLMDTDDIQEEVVYYNFAKDVSYGKVFCKTILSDGGVMFHSESGAPTVAQALSHEVFELLVDPLCNSWWDSGDGQTLFAREVCDPVESNVVTVTIIVTPAKNIFNAKTRLTTITPAVTQTFGLSDWILPAWSDHQNTKGPYNHLKTVKAPFTLDTGGYAIRITGGRTGNVTNIIFGSKVTEDQKAIYSDKDRITKRMI